MRIVPEFRGIFQQSDNELVHVTVSQAATTSFFLGIVLLISYSPHTSHTRTLCKSWDCENALQTP